MQFCLQLWGKEQMEVNNRISSVFTMSCSISSQLYALLIGLVFTNDRPIRMWTPGSYIESWPMIFPHTITASACGLLLAFLFSSWLSASIKRFAQLKQNKFKQKQLSNFYKEKTFPLSESEHCILRTILSRNNTNGDIPKDSKSKVQTDFFRSVSISWSVCPSHVWFGKILNMVHNNVESLESQ